LNSELSEPRNNDANENKIYGTGLFGCGIGDDLGFKTPTGRFRGGIMISHDREMDDKEGVFVHELDFDALNKHRAAALDIFVHHARFGDARPDDRGGRDDVLVALAAHAVEERTHRRAFDVEAAYRPARTDEFGGGRVALQRFEIVKNFKVFVLQLQTPDTIDATFLSHNTPRNLGTMQHF
jgi:hypothetical protein